MGHRDAFKAALAKVESKAAGGSSHKLHGEGGLGIFGTVLLIVLVLYLLGVLR